jgi:hypothetical protein
MASPHKLEIVPPAAPMKPEDILKPEELAARLKVSKYSIFEQTRARWKIRNPNKTPLPFFRFAGQLRFYWPDVCEWLAKNKET